MLLGRLWDFLWWYAPYSISMEEGREREMFYLTTHSTHFIYGYMASDIWLRTILIVRKETRCRHIGYSYRLAARVLLYAPSHRQDNTYHGLCYTSRGTLAGTRSMEEMQIFVKTVSLSLSLSLSLCVCVRVCLCLCVCVKRLRMCSNGHRVVIFFLKFGCAILCIWTNE